MTVDPESPFEAAEVHGRPSAARRLLLPLSHGPGTAAPRAFTAARAGAEAPEDALRGAAQGLPRRTARFIGPLRLGTAPSLLAIDLCACLVAGATMHLWARSFLLVISVTLAMMAAGHLYRRRLTMSVLDDLPCIVLALTLGELVAFALQPAVRVDRRLFHAVVFFLIIILFRAAAYSCIRRARREGLVHDVGLVIGAGHVGIRLARDLLGHAEYGVVPVGFVDSTPRITDAVELPVPLLGDYSDLSTLINDFNVSVVVVAYGSLKEADLVDVLRTCDRLECDIFFVPRLFELHHLTRDMDLVWGTPLIRVRRAPFRSPVWRLKRLVDIVAAAVGLVLAAPVFLVCAVAVRWEGGPGVLFHQERVGVDGKRFDLVKLRSYRPTAHTNAETTWSITGHAQLGPVGAFLRRSSLDELPQLWSVLMGRMTLVGPRPERPHFVDQFAQHVPRYIARHRVPAGLTGWAQIHGLRGDTSIPDRARFDNYYIENWSLWGDVKILLRTTGQVLRRSGG